MLTEQVVLSHGVQRSLLGIEKVCYVLKTMGGKGKKRANKAGLSRPQQSGQHKKGNKGQAQPEFSETVVLKGRPGKSVPVPVSKI